MDPELRAIFLRRGIPLRRIHAWVADGHTFLDREGSLVVHKPPKLGLHESLAAKGGVS